MTEKTLLCIDDDEATLRALQRLLHGEEYRVLVAKTVSEAFAFLSQETIQVVMADQRMPDITGSELLQQIKEKYPTILRVILSGYADVSAILESINEGEVYRFLSKPWDSNALKVMLRQSFEHYELQQLNRELFQKINAQNDHLNQLNNALGEMVENRTYLLRLIQEVVQHIPLPFVAFDLEGQIVTANAGFICRVPNLSVLGGNIGEIFSIDVAGQIRQLLQQPIQKEGGERIEGGLLGNLQVVLFSFDAEIRGAIVLLLQAESDVKAR